MRNAVRSIYIGVEDEVGGSYRLFSIIRNLLYKRLRPGVYVKIDPLGGGGYSAMTSGARRDPGWRHYDLRMIIVDSDIFEEGHENIRFRSKIIRGVHSIEMIPCAEAMILRAYGIDVPEGATTSYCKTVLAVHERHLDRKIENYSLEELCMCEQINAIVLTVSESAAIHPAVAQR